MVRILENSIQPSLGLLPGSSLGKVHPNIGGCLRLRRLPLLGEANAMRFKLGEEGQIKLKHLIAATTALRSSDKSI